MDSLGIENPEAKLAEILAEKATIRDALGGFPDDQDTGGDAGGSDGGGDE
jgi:hypothetical protein